MALDRSLLPQPTLSPTSRKVLGSIAGHPVQMVARSPQ